MQTEKLFWTDPFLETFDGARGAVGSYQGRPSVVLDRTVFYPESGGQLADTGSLTGAGWSLRVADVQADDQGVIHHLLDADVAPTAVLGSGPLEGVRLHIDVERRREHMAQHTAQHMLSRALVDLARAETVSARLGGSARTIDVDRPSLSDAELVAIEDRVNDLVRGDLPVRAFFPTPEELAALPLRRAPKVSTGIRVIAIEGFDVSPCGGTHCTRTGQIGLVRVVGVEKYKGMTRVSFHAARRALAEVRAKEAVLLGLSRGLTCGPLDVPAGIARLRGELKAQHDALSAARGELARMLIERLLQEHAGERGGAGAPCPIVVRRPAGEDVGSLRTLAGGLTARPDVLALVAAPEKDGAFVCVVVQRGAACAVDCNAWLRALAQETGGRGGGRPERAEGRIPASVDLEARLHAACTAP